MAEFPRDRFDDVPSEVLRVGAHRAPHRKGRGWLWLGWAVLATVILTTGGLIGLAAINSNINFDLPFFPGQPGAQPPTPPPPPPAAPPPPPPPPPTILNGTPTAGLANQVGDALVAQGWGGAAVGVGSRANAATRDIEETVVYYADPSYEGAARGLVLALGVGDIRLSADYPGSPVTVVIGADYRPLP